MDTLARPYGIRLPGRCCTERKQTSLPHLYTTNSVHYKKIKKYRNYTNCRSSMGPPRPGAGNHKKGVMAKRKGGGMPKWALTNMYVSAHWHIGELVLTNIVAAPQHHRGSRIPMVQCNITIGANCVMIIIIICIGAPTPQRLTHQYGACTQSYIRHKIYDI
jgi:hypothetical protein